MTDSEKIDQILQHVLELENQIRALISMGNGNYVNNQVGGPVALASSPMPYGMDLWWRNQNRGF